MIKHLTPLQSVKRYCRYECCANEMESWRNCTVTDCPLFCYRMGHRPRHNTQKTSNDKKQAVSPMFLGKKGPPRRRLVKKQPKETIR